MSSGEESTPPVAVFDCMTFLQATASPAGPAAACFRLVEDGRVRLVTSADILREVRDVLSRPKVRARNRRLTDEVVTAFLQRLVELAPPRADVPSSLRYPRDPKDEPYLNLALVEKAAFLVSRDNDLLDLMRDDSPDGQALRAVAPGLRVVTPPEFLTVVRSMTEVTRPAPQEGAGEGPGGGP